MKNFPSVLFFVLGEKKLPSPNQYLGKRRVTNVERYPVSFEFRTKLRSVKRTQQQHCAFLFFRAFPHFLLPPAFATFLYAVGFLLFLLCAFVSVVLVVIRERVYRNVEGWLSDDKNFSRPVVCFRLCVNLVHAEAEPLSGGDAN